ELTGDFLASLGAYLLLPTTPAEHVEIVRRHWGYPIGPDKIRFLAGVKYKEGKRTYYSVSEEKVSASDSKQHDKRWAVVPEFATGPSTENVWRLLDQFYGGLLSRIGRWQEIK